MVAIELHPHRVDILRRQVARRAKVVQADLKDLYLPGRPFRVVANPPYGLSTTLVRTLLGAQNLRSADLVLQLGAARGLAGDPPRARHTRTYRLAVGDFVPRDAFVNPPPVQSSVLRIRRR